MLNILPKQLLTPLVISFAVLLVVFVVLQGELTPLYHLVMISVFGTVLMRHQNSIAVFLQSLPLHASLRFIILGYMAVIGEETLVGLMYSIQEGFSIALMFERVSQFISFNLLAFTGLILGSSIVLRRLALRPLDLLLIIGAWGLFAEKTILAVFTYPIPALALILPTMCVYAIIMAPAYLSLKPDERGKKLWPFWRRSLTLWGVMFILSVPPVTVLGYLRDNYPSAFPPCKYIPCN